MTTRKTRRWRVAVLAVALTGFACGSDSTSTTVASTSSASTTSPTIEEPVSTTAPTTTTTASSTTTSSSSTTIDEPTPIPCATAPAGAHLVDVALDDPDGGLNLRTAAGTDAAIVLPLPAGTEVVSSGECVVVDGGAQWWQVAAATDPTVEGWVSAAYLVEKAIVPCPRGLASVDSLVGLSITVGDFDGDGATDRLYLGNDAEAETVVMAVEFADGGLAEGPLSMPLYTEVTAVIRPIGAARDVVMFRDVFGGGASTSRFVFGEVVDCTVRDFGSLDAGASAGWGSVGFCLEPTPLGMRVWRWTAIGADEELRAANRTDDPFHYFESQLVPGTGELDGRTCLEDFPGRSFRVGSPWIDTRGVGSEAETIDELVDVVAALVGADDDSLIIPVGEPEGIDAQGGFGVYDIVGLKDDSVGGYRMQLEFSTILVDGTLAAVRADRVVLIPLCSRGVTEKGLCV